MIFGTGACTFDVLFTVESVPEFGSTVRARNFAVQLGGPVASALVALRRFGLAAKVFGEVGDDEPGRQILKWLKAEDVDVQHLRLRAQSDSRIVLVLVDCLSGERSFTFRPDSFTMPSLDLLDSMEFASCKLLIVDEATEFSIEAARRCKLNGGKVIFTGGWYRGSINQLICYVDAFIISQEFIRDWNRSDDGNHTIEEFFLQGRFRFGIQTNGENGCIVQTPEAIESYHAFRIKPIDTTGAGDAFGAGIAYGMIQGWALPYLVKFASACAAMNCLTLGSSNGLTTVSAVVAFINESENRKEV